MPASFWNDNSAKPIAIAHRGGAGLYSLDRHRRENTLSVFKAAAKRGYKYLELDVTNTADDAVVVLHVTADKFEALLRKPSAPNAQKLQKYTYEELKTLLGRNIPTLEQVLKALPDTCFLVDAKTDEVVEPLAELIKKTKSKDRVYLNSFFAHRVVKLRELLGKDLECGVIIGRHPRLFNSRLKALYRGDFFGRGFTAITLPRRYLTKGIVDLIHSHGLHVLVWAPNTEAQINKAVQHGADGIIADNANLLIKMIKP